MNDVWEKGLGATDGRWHLGCRLALTRIITVLVVVVACLACPSARAGTITEVTGFGSNPGNLKMFKYVPDDLPTPAPLVVALHGCLQNAHLYGEKTGWTAFADRYHFALLLPEQQLPNNSAWCFNWFLVEDNERGKQEALTKSILPGST
jgi:poly(3-hydroxybutyrate) depolymerase